MQKLNEYNFSGKRALVRVDYNVPLTERLEVRDDTRIALSIPTIKKILNDGGSAILMSHMGRPRGFFESRNSMVHLIPVLKKHLNCPVFFSNYCMGETVKAMAKTLEPGQVLLLENLRYYRQEQAGSEEFAKALSELGDVYVNDAFGTAHRKHASTTMIAKYFPGNKMFGKLMEKEIENSSKLLANINRPFTAIVGGAKISGKIAMISNLLDKADNIIVGGGMSFTFEKAKGRKTGLSITEDDRIPMALELMKKAKKKKVRFMLPIDYVVSDSFSEDTKSMVCAADKIPDGFMGLDIGPETIKEYCEVLRSSKTILWNGPLGVFEIKKFENGTREIGQAVVDATKSGAFSLVGGGDSVAAANKYGFASQVSDVSTGGGALLEFLEGRELPGIKAMLNGSS